jgi:monoamine oxidase
VEGLSEGIDVRFKAVVEGITSTPNDIEVRTAGGEVFRAAKVVIAVPLGVLKNQYAVFVFGLYSRYDQRFARTISFHPPLPDSKLVSISRLGMGLINKVILQFSRVFWRTDVDMFGVVSSQRWSIY